MWTWFLFSSSQQFFFASTPAIVCTTQNPAVKNCDSYLYVWFLLVHILMANGSGGRWEDLQLGGCPRWNEQAFSECAQASVGFVGRDGWSRPLSLLSGGESLKFWYVLENELWIEAWALCVVHWKVCTHWSSPMLDATQFPFSSSNYVPILWLTFQIIHSIRFGLNPFNPYFLLVQSSSDLLTSVLLKSQVLVRQISIFHGERAISDARKIHIYTMCIGELPIKNAQTNATWHDRSAKVRLVQKLCDVARGAGILLSDWARKCKEIPILF